MIIFQKIISYINKGYVLLSFYRKKIQSYCLKKIIIKHYKKLLSYCLKKKIITMKFCNMNLSTLFLVTLITLSVLLEPALSAPVRLVKRPKGSIISYLFARLKKLKFFAYVPFIIYLFFNCRRRTL